MLEVRTQMVRVQYTLSIPHKFFEKRKRRLASALCLPQRKDAVYVTQSEILTCLTEGDQEVEQVGRTDLAIAVRIKWASAT